MLCDFLIETANLENEPHLLKQVIFGILEIPVVFAKIT